MARMHQYTSYLYRRGFLLLPFLALIPLVAVLSASAGDAGGKESFRKGKADLEAGRYSEAITNLSIAQKEFSILADYALFYLAEAYHHLGEHDKALSAIESHMKQYPSSVLKKKARMIEIRETKESSKREPLALYESYVRDFPDDEEAYFTYGLMLKKDNDASRASSVFRKVYARAGRLAAAARAELSAEEITTADIMERASNLMKMYDFKDAEHDLRQALARCHEKEKKELLKSLAHALFKQKKYREAAVVYDKVNDSYFKARSLYRSGDMKGFGVALQELVGKNDKKAALLFITLAADKRRENDFEGALHAYQDVLRKYPEEAEEALWGIGWTQYLSGNYRKSAEVFSQLHETYNNPRYLYWQARSIEATGEDATGVYRKITSAENSFYAVMVYAKQGQAIPRPASALGLPDLAEDKPLAHEKIDALISLDMKGEAVMELTALCRQLSSPSDLLYCASILQHLGEFKRAIALVTKIPYSETLHRFWYPLAFWNTVEYAAGRNGLDPYIILSVMREESRFDQTVKSPAGAYGLMQLMPHTAYRLDRDLNLGIRKPAQLTDPNNNIVLGSYYLKELSEEFHSLPHVLAAYNAGELAVRSWQKRFAYRSADEFIEDIPYAETRNYVKKVITSYFQYKRVAASGGSDHNVGTIFGGL